MQNDANLWPKYTRSFINIYTNTFRWVKYIQGKEHIIVSSRALRFADRPFVPNICLLLLNTYTVVDINADFVFIFRLFSTKSKSLRAYYTTQSRRRRCCRRCRSSSTAKIHVNPHRMIFKNSRKNYTYKRIRRTTVWLYHPLCPPCKRHHAIPNVPLVCLGKRKLCTQPDTKRPREKTLL